MTVFSLSKHWGFDELLDEHAVSDVTEFTTRNSAVSSELRLHVTTVSRQAGNRRLGDSSRRSLATIREPFKLKKIDKPALLTAS
jgi:hypothetical protein